MAEPLHIQEARERVLVAAEKLFSQRGFSSVTLRDIAAEVGIRHTSLYHHVPGGKEELFIEVMERNLRRHQAGMTAAIEQAGPDIQLQLYSVADWLLSQPPMDLVRMVHADLVEIDPSEGHRLSELTLTAMIEPINTALRKASDRGEIAFKNLGVVAGGLLGMIESLYSVPEYALEQSRQEMAHDLIDAMLTGLRPR